MTVRLVHKAGSAQAVATALNGKGWTILNAECTRSAYRYATWNLTMGFIPLAHACLGAAESHAQNIAEEFREEVRNVKDLILSQCADYIFTSHDEIDADLSVPVEAYPMHALAYFHAKACAGLKDPNSDEDLWRPLSLTVEREGFVRGSDRFGSVLELYASELLEPLPVAVSFVEMDTDNANIRVAPITQEMANQFAHIVLQYKRRGGRSSQGLVQSILEPIKNDINLYRITNTSKRDDPRFEEGEYHIFGKMLGPNGTGLGKDVDSCKRALADLKEKIEKEVVPPDQIHEGERPRDISINIVSAKLLSNRRTNAYIRALEDRRHVAPSYDVFIGHDSDDKDLVEDIRRDLLERNIDIAMDSKNFEPGKVIEKEVIDYITLSTNLLVFLTKNALDSNWVHFEIGVAKALGRRVLILFRDQEVIDAMPTYLKDILCVPWLEKERLYNAITSGKELDF